jgi:hypothetical protein
MSVLAANQLGFVRNAAFLSAGLLILMGGEGIRPALFARWAALIASAVLLAIPLAGCLLCGIFTTDARPR